jgi:hypothetical protein
MRVPASDTPRGSAARATADPAAVAVAVVVATAPASSGGPAALLAWEDGSLLSRLLGQLRVLGVPDVRVLTRPEWEDDVRAVAGAAGAVVQTPAAIEADLRAIAATAGDGRGAVVVLPGEIVTHTEALAGLLKDPRIPTGVLLGGDHAGRFAFPVRSRRGRIVSAASPYHAVHRPTGVFLGVVKVVDADRRELAAVAERLAGLVVDSPPGWAEELDRKAEMWRARLWRAQGTTEGEDQVDDRVDEPLDDDDGDQEGDEDALPAGARPRAEDERRLGEWLKAAEGDVTALLLLGLVRAGVHVGASRLRRLYWSRPLAPEAVELATERIGRYDEEKALLDSAVKPTDGFFTTHFVSPYSRYIARAAARRGLTPNQVTVASMLIGVGAAAAFSTGTRAGLVTGAVLLQAAFTADCVDGQLARYTRTFSNLGAWLDSILDRAKEYVVFAGLAIGASRMGESVWLLACCALTLQTVRHVGDFGFWASQARLIGETDQPPLEQVHDAAGAEAAARRSRGDAASQPPRPPARNRVLRLWTGVNRVPGVLAVKKMLAFPIGERFAVISITAALFTPRVTFVAVLVWGGFAALYTLTGRVLRSLAGRARRARASAVRGEDVVHRDDGPLARALGRGLGRRLPVPALVLDLAGVAGVVLAAVAAGGDAPVALAGAVVAWLVLTAGLAGGRRPREAFAWADPPLVRVGEYAALIWLAAIEGEHALPAAFALLAALAYRHYDLVYRLRFRGDLPSSWLNAVALGWDARLVLAWLLLALGALPAAMFVWAAALGVASLGETVLAWRGFEQARRPGGYELAEDDAG